MFEHVLRLVSEETEIPSGQIVSRRRDTDTVDARYLLVYFLFQVGLSTAFIARRMGVTQRTVTFIHSNFSDRVSMQKFMRINCENIRKRLGNN